MLKAIIDEILEPSASWGPLFEPIYKWGAYFEEITKRKEVFDLADSRKRTLLPHGLAIDPHSASTCLKDIVRTTQYTRGLFAAIKKTLNQIKNRPVHVVYAGSGPYAPFAMAMTTQFSSKELQFTIIDIHQESLDSVKAIVEELKVESYIRNYLCEDAVSYTNYDDLPIDIGISECLNKALIKEPQVAISMNLVKQMEPSGLLIPQKIKVDAYLINPKIEFSYVEDNEGNLSFNRTEATKKRTHIAHLLDLSKPVVINLLGITNGDLNKNYNIELGLKIVPEHPAENNTLMYTTTINIFGDFWIDEYQSGLTQPQLEQHKERIPEKGELSFSYKLCTNPEFDYRVHRKTR